MNKNKYLEARIQKLQEELNAWLKDTSHPQKYQMIQWLEKKIKWLKIQERK